MTEFFISSLLYVCIYWHGLTSKMNSGNIAHASGGLENGYKFLGDIAMQSQRHNPTVFSVTVSSMNTFTNNPSWLH